MYVTLPSGCCPSILQATFASSELKPFEVHTEPQTLLLQISKRPLYDDSPESRTLPSIQLVGIIPYRVIKTLSDI